MATDRHRCVLESITIPSCHTLLVDCAHANLFHWTRAGVPMFALEMVT